MFLNIKTHKKGSALYLVIAMLAILLPLALSLTSILSGQLSITKDMGSSVVAIYAADAGIEQSLMGGALGNWRAEGAPASIPLTDLGGGRMYSVNVYEGKQTMDPPHSLCATDDSLYYCVHAVGKYQRVHRSIWSYF